jgi:hypothetical protein
MDRDLKVVKDSEYTSCRKSRASELGGWHLAHSEPKILTGKRKEPTDRQQHRQKNLADLVVI